MTNEVTGIARRKLIVGGACALVGAGAIAVPALRAALGDGGETQDSAGTWWTPAQLVLSRAGFDEWGRQVGTAFVIRTETGSLSATLTAVKPLNSEGDRPDAVSRDRAFALVFNAGRSAAKGDRIYPVQHPTHGDLNIYFSPSAGGLLAVFN